ncbi:uncharacterized protein TNCV_197001 [Trichonephila clavipes]|uniref:SAM domain-containing protein n=1 Tax=Trichonephila clavipes TaxID=2585209 RepID=A0A8X6WIQ9_TRICX|nr:uncharacterized protein TNCV_197001 [Trichonephila clavipes]
MTEKISLPHPLTVYRWKEEKVIKWLKRVNLEDCIPAFEIRRIDGPKLLELTEQKLFTYQDLKIKHRKFFCNSGRGSLNSSASPFYPAPHHSKILELNSLLCPV